MPRPALLGQLALLATACTSGTPGGSFVFDAGTPPPPPDATVRFRDAATPDAGGEIDAALLDAGAPEAASWEAASIYLLMVDRFADGAPDPDPADDPCFDPANPRRFHGGDLVGLRARLDYLQALGVDTLWVTPLTRQIGLRGEECGYHGYWTDATAPDDGALEPRLGTDEDLHALLDDLHARGMRLILDMVVNHPGYDAPVTRSHPAWFHPVDGCERLGDPDQTCPLARLPDYDQDVPEVADYLTAQSLGWLARFDVDGVRMDTVKHVPLSFFADRWIPAVRDARGADLYLLGELFDEGAYATQRPYLDAGFDGLFDFRLRRALVDGLGRDGTLDAVAVRVAEAVRELGPERARLRSLFLENHDVPRYATEIQAPTPELAVARQRLAIGVLMTTPGIPQLYAGGELGMAGAWPDNRRDFPAWGFDPSSRGPREGYLGDPADTFALTHDLLALRRELPALHAGGYAELWRPGGSGVPLYAFVRDHGDAPVVVTMSTGEVRQRLPIRTNPGLDAATQAALVDGTVLEDRLGRATGARAVVVDGELEVELPAHAVAVWALPR
ncbi:MAG: glycosidase [Sandaracinaceae bacterium]|nr:glycosidase [Sandaracinaceae bacterium]